MPKIRPPKTLTPKQERFVDEYLLDLNATQAAFRAGYSRKTANEQATQLLAKPNVKSAIDRAIKERSKRTRIDADFVLQRLFDEANANLADLFDEKNNIKPIEAWPKIWKLGLVTGLDVEEIVVDGVVIGHRKRLRLSDRVRRLELIGKHAKVSAFQNIVEFKGLEGLAARLARAKVRAEG